MIYTNDLKQFKGQPLQIKNVATFGAKPYYFVGYTETIGFRTYVPTEDKMIFIYKYWDSANKTFTEEEVRLTWEEIEMTKADKTKYTAETYVIEINKIKYPFYKTFKKVYDLNILLEKEQDIIKYTKKDGTVETEYGKELLLKGVGVGKICGILEDVLDLDLDRNDNGYLISGGEEKELSKLDGITFKFTVKGTGLGTKYTWKESGFENKKSDSLIEALPGDEDISIEDLPF